MVRKIEVDGLTHAFGTRVVAVDDASFNVDEGEFVSILGPSGCGKTTVLNIIAGLHDVQKGSVRVAGSAPKAGRHDVSYMLARDCLFPWRTAYQNVMLGGEYRGINKRHHSERARTFLNEVGLAAFATHYPRELSHGMRQRVALARTFALESPILLMDEPFGALDAQTKFQLEETLLRLCEIDKRTVVFITHDLSEAVVLSDRVIVMSARPGRILADIRIDLERPRSVRSLQKDPAYHKLYTEVWYWLEQALTGNEAADAG